MGDGSELIRRREGQGWDDGHGPREGGSGAAAYEAVETGTLSTQLSDRDGAYDTMSSAGHACNSGDGVVLPPESVQRGPPRHGRCLIKKNCNLAMQTQFLQQRY